MFGRGGEEVVILVVLVGLWMCVGGDRFGVLGRKLVMCVEVASLELVVLLVGRDDVVEAVVIRMYVFFNLIDFSSLSDDGSGSLGSLPCVVVICWLYSFPRML